MKGFCLHVPEGCVVVHLDKRPVNFADVCLNVIGIDVEIEFNDWCVVDWRPELESGAPGPVAGVLVYVRGYPAGFLFMWPPQKEAS